MPKADLLFCRDCFIHLSDDMIALAIENILRSDIRYLLTTTYPEGENRTIHNGDWFTVNLCAAPYNFPPPIRALDDWVPPFDRHQLALWEIDSLRRTDRRPNPRLRALLPRRAAPAMRITPSTDPPLVDCIREHRNAPD